MRRKHKVFVLDTNVILYDFRCIYSFEEHDVVVPITVLEEIDKFKRGGEIINYNAREFSRELDELGGDDLLSEGLGLDGGGTIFVSTEVAKNQQLSEVFWEDKPDHRILAVAHNLAARDIYERVVLVSKDINLRMKAKSIGLHSEDYETGKIQNIDELYTGRTTLENVESAAVDALYSDGDVPLSRVQDADGFVKAEGRPYPNEYFIVDEAQNLTPHEVKTIITRAGEGTKMVFTGDPHQIDTPYLDSRSNGLTYLIDKMKGRPLYAHVTLEKGERSRLSELAANVL